jgi:transcriptional regulator of acetoin/glycerol metabolism
VRHRWPGNVRELENVLVRAYVMSAGDVIAAGDVTLGRAPSLRTREDFEREEARRILAALNANRWNVRAVCRELGIPSNTLYRKLKRYRIERPA